MSCTSATADSYFVPLLVQVRQRRIALVLYLLVGIIFPVVRGQQLPYHRTQIVLGPTEAHRTDAVIPQQFVERLLALTLPAGVSPKLSPGRKVHYQHGQLNALLLHRVARLIVPL